MFRLWKNILLIRGDKSWECLIQLFMYVNVKAGDCSLADYSLSKVPIEIAKDIDTKIEKCEKCGSKYIILIENNINTIPMRVKEMKDE